MEPGSLSRPDEARVAIALDAVCHDCEHWHQLGRTPQGFTAELWEWEVKHRGHTFEFLSPKRRLPAGLDERPYLAMDEPPWWLTYAENANVKLAYAAAAAMACTLTSLATSSTFIAGREADALDNTSNLYVDYRITAKIMTGTTPTVNTEIRLYAFAAMDDTPTWPDQMTGANAARAVTNANIVDGGLTLLGATAVTATTGVSYPLRCVTLAEAFGHVPKRTGFYVSHATVAALNATSTNHVLTQIGAYVTST